MGNQSKGHARSFCCCLSSANDIFPSLHGREGERHTEINIHVRGLPHVPQQGPGIELATQVHVPDQELNLRPSPWTDALSTEPNQLWRACTFLRYSSHGTWQKLDGLFLPTMGTNHNSSNHLPFPLVSVSTDQSPHILGLSMLPSHPLICLKLCNPLHLRKSLKSSLLSHQPPPPKFKISSLLVS